MSILDQAGWMPEAHALVEDLLAGPSGLAVFDFDNTLIRNDLGEAVMYYILFQALLRADLPQFWDELPHPAIADDEVDHLKQIWRSMEAQGTDENEDVYLSFVDAIAPLYGKVYKHSGMDAAYRWSRILFAFQSEKELQSIARYVLDYECNQPLGQSELPSGLTLPRGIRVYAEVRALLKELLARDWDVRIVTASPEAIIAAVSQRWGIAPEKVHGMRLTKGAVTSVDGETQELLLPQIVEPMTVQQGKVDRLLAETDQPLRFMMGDSIGDWELLQHAERAVLIDRGDAELAEKARAAGLPVQTPFPVPEAPPPDSASFI